MSSEQKKVKFTSPIGIATYAWLSRPCTKFDRNGVYEATLQLDPTDLDAAYKFEDEERKGVKAFLEDLDRLIDAAVLETKRKNPEDRGLVIRQPAWREELDKCGNKTGKAIVKFKLKANTKEWSTGEVITMKPKLFDANGDPMTEEIWSGSRIHVAFVANQYYLPKTMMAGVSLNLRAVQVFDLVTSSADAYF